MRAPQKAFVSLLTSILAALFFLALPFAVAEQTALMIVDMQPYFYKDVKINADFEGKLILLVRRQQELIRLAIAQRFPIVIVEYDLSHTSDESLKQTLHPLKEAIGSYSNVKTIIKKTDGAFDYELTRAELHRFLAPQQITRIVITGVNGGSCVRRTIEGALTRGYKIWTDANAIADFNYAEVIFPNFYVSNSLWGISYELSSKNHYQVKTSLELDRLMQGLEIESPQGCEKALGLAP